MPYTGEGAEGLGKPLKIMTHPLREIPIWIGAEGPKNVTQTCQIADGWIPLYYSPWRAEVYHEHIVDRPLDFEIGVNVSFRVGDVEESLWTTRGFLGFYIGGMGAKGQNYHTKLMARMGFEEAHEIQDLFFEGKRDEAIAKVPIEFADEISLVGSPERIKDRLQAWEESAVTMINVAPRTVEEVWQIAELVKGESLAPARRRPRGDDYDQRWRDLTDSGEGIHGEADLISALSAGGSVLDRLRHRSGRDRAAAAATRSSASTSTRECSTPPERRPRTRVASRRPARRRPRPHLRPCRAPRQRHDLLSPGTEADVVANMARHLATAADWSGFQLGEGRYRLADFDDAAAAVGLELEHRWSTWSREPFVADGADYAVSVHRRAMAVR